jgi:DNA segregation ATPase FtsK/SpoIIIE, S-DNA-T family
MHMVVLGWFGGSVVWFLPLLWRVVKSLLPNGGGLRGPGTIRLWIGFFCALLSGCTLEAALFHSFAFYADVNRCGQALFGLLGESRGGEAQLAIGLGAALVFLVSLPWLCNFQWRSVAAWANTAFGLGLKPEWLAVSAKAVRETPAREKPSRGRVSRDRGEVRGMGGIADSVGFLSGSGGMPGRTSHDAPAIGIPSPTSREGGRYQRPTVWRPPPARKADTQKPAAGVDAARTAATYSDRYPSARPAASAGNRQAGRPDPLEPVEPVAPEGWLRFDETLVKREGTGATANDAARTQQPYRPAGEPANKPQPAGVAGGSVANPVQPAGAEGDRARQQGVDGSRPSRPTAGADTARSAPVQRSSSDRIAAAAASSLPGRSVSAGVAGSASRLPVKRDTPVPSQPIPPAGPPPAPDAIKAALRAIEEKTARWAVRGASTPGASDSGENVASARTVNGAMESTMMDAAISPHVRDAALSPLAPTTPASPPAEVTAQGPAATAAASPEAPQPASRESASTEPQAAADKVPPSAPLSHATIDPEAPPAFSHIAGAYSATSQNLDGYTFISSDQSRADRKIDGLDTTGNISPGDAIEHRDGRIGHLAEQASTPPETSNPPAAPKTDAADEPDAQWNLASSWPAVGQVDDADAPLHEPLQEPLHEPLHEPLQEPLAGSIEHEPDRESGSSALRFDLPPSGSPLTRDEWASTASRSTVFPQQGTEPQESPEHLEPEPGTEITPAEPEPEPASNIVQFPRAVPAIPTAVDPSPAEADARPPVRGFIPTEFEFHAPAASAVELPGLDLLEPASDEVEPVSERHLAETGQLIEQRLQEFKVPVTVVGASAGPVITRFEVEPALGVRGSQIVGLMKDLSRGLGLTSIRVVETIPGKTCMGLELPNAKRQMIRLSEILEADVYRDSKSFLTIAMGKDIVGNPVVTDLARAPHMLVAGTTGSGKSVAINAMILSLLYKATPADVRLIMIDPKMLELSVYEGIPHLLAPVVTDMKLAANALNWCVGEMEKRYKLMSAVGVRNLQGFNQKVRNADTAGKKLTNPFSLTPDAPEPLSTLPMIVVVIDELADLMMVAGKQIEQLIARLAQKARAAGIHLILATQRPSVDVITGLIKANIPTRVAFQVSSKIDSRTILDQMGAESLLGAGDMLFLPPGTGYPQRVHGAFVADEEVHSVVEYLKQFGEPEYEEGILSGPTGEGGTQDLFGDAPDAEADPLYDEAVSFVLRTRRASISSVQRQLRIGYNRAARLVEQMETAGLVSPMGTNGNREVLAPGTAD